MICEEQFHQRLMEAIKSGVTIDLVAKELGVHPNTIKDWEQAKSAPPAFSRETIVQEVEAIKPYTPN